MNKKEYLQLVLNKGLAISSKVPRAARIMASLNALARESNLDTSQDVTSLAVTLDEFKTLMLDSSGYDLSNEEKFNLGRIKLLLE